MITILICITWPDLPYPFHACCAGSTGCLLIVLLALVLTLPVLAVLASWLQWDAASAQILGEMAAPCCRTTPGPRWSVRAGGLGVAAGGHGHGGGGDAVRLSGPAHV
jgi:hypothetical protein